jgi:translation initiation factor 2 beta subunit (eIF-2beta)/eIF-5
MSKKDMMNVNGTTDPFYRYVMPKIEIKVEGTNKMIRTYIININNIAECLNRTPDYIITFLGQDLSVNQCYEKQTDRYYVTGKYEQHKIQSSLQKMINAYILCKKCGNPETMSNLIGKKKNSTIELVCRSCGYTAELDNTDKFVKYMLLHQKCLWYPGTKKEDSDNNTKKEDNDHNTKKEDNDHNTKKEDSDHNTKKEDGAKKEDGSDDNNSVDIDNL